MSVAYWLSACMFLGCADPSLAVAPHSRIVVEAVGIGRPPARMTGPRARMMARRAAEVLAVRNLTQKLKIDRSRSSRRGTYYESFSGPVQGFRYGEPQFLADGRVLVRVTLKPQPRVIHYHWSW